MAQLASTLCRRRRYTEAKQLLSDVISLRANVFGVHHDETDQARQQLATLKENETPFKGPKDPAPIDAALTPLDRVASLGILETAKLLFRLGVSPQRQLNAHEGPALFGAIRGGHLEMVKLLLAHKADVSAKFPGSGVTPIQCAINLKRLDIWPLLLDHSTDYSDIGIGNCALNDAFCRGSRE